MYSHFFIQNFRPIHHSIFETSITLGEVFSIIVLALTALILCWQAWETRKSSKYLEYSSRPTAYFLLYRSHMVVKNTSSYLVKFYFRIYNSKDVLLDDNRWFDRPDGSYGPLYIYPGAGYIHFPSAFNILDKVENFPEKLLFEYRIVPGHIDDDLYDSQVQKINWEIAGKMRDGGQDVPIWIGPNHIPEEGVTSFINQ